MVKKRSLCQVDVTDMFVLAPCLIYTSSMGLTLAAPSSLARKEGAEERKREREEQGGAQGIAFPALQNRRRESWN